ncbi:hypothetical protein [Acinetobacter pollinis]|uniref:Uncharacterized protein n=1 Tax=Acinetobacter pollinis TaxID=2605270 RepID=A0ABU6DTE0_9GAMM|nr:hypothetical protein [Acinetobacter pollinis]MEB5477121.1 hypothetical protein [Acinetobacter pollinis]
MKKLKVITFLILLFIGESLYAKKTNEEISCDTHTTILTVYKKSDFKVVSRTCQDDNPYISNYLVNNRNSTLINKYSLDIGKWIPKLAAVSIYNNSSSPVLITIHTQYWDTPTISGTSYDINLYKIININGKVQLIDISKILGEDQSGLDGTSDEVMHFKLKDISSIKKWLDKNYK